MLVSYNKRSASKSNIKMINNMWNSIKNYWNKCGHSSEKTTVDEKAVATAKEIKRRYHLTKQELSDVADAVRVGNQIEMLVIQ